MHAALPPLNALRAFEAAARLGSMSNAAEELAVTPGALSHQIRGLEDFLDIKLFERLPRAIRLTPAGETLYPGLQVGFQQIREAVAAMRRTTDPNLLVLSTPPGLTAKWLAPRLYRFADAVPGVEVRVSSTTRNADFVTDGVDIAVRNVPTGQAAPPGMAHDFLVDIEFLPVCSPSLLARYGPFDSPSDLARAPLIQDETFVGRANMPQWQDWFEAAGAPEAAHGRSLSFSDADHALGAAVEGAGVLLSHNILAHDDLASGRLVAPFSLMLGSGRSYCLVYPERAAERANVAAFRDWALQEIAAMRGCAELALDCSLLPDKQGTI